MQKINFRAFTLVELIVVITIVGILSTVGFVSYSGYLTGARDSNRISQMVRLSDSLQVYSANKTLPLPDDNIQITASGTLIGYQGEVGVDVLETIDYTNGGTDPKDGDYYTYYLTRDRSSLQLMALMEESRSVASLPLKKGVPAGGGIISQSYANFEDRFPKVYGRKLGILTYNDDSDTTLRNTPANLISANITAGFLDVFNLTEEYTANLGDTGSISGVGNIVGIAMLGDGRLTGAWNFDGVSGINILDISGKGNTGVLSGSPLPTTVSGVSGNAFDFVSVDGTSGGYIEVPASSDIDTGTFTFSFWVNSDDAIDGSHSSLIVKNFIIESDSSDKIFTFKWDGANVSSRQRCRITGESGNSYDTYIQSTIQVGDWNHILCSFDGERLSVYLNGEFEESIYVNEPIKRGKAAMTIGAGGQSAGSADSYFDGQIDEFYLYKKPFSAEEVKILYNATK